MDRPDLRKAEIYLGKYANLKGKRFGYIEILDYKPIGDFNQARVTFLCHFCGDIKTLSARQLRTRLQKGFITCNTCVRHYISPSKRGALSGRHA